MRCSEWCVGCPVSVGYTVCVACAVCGVYCVLCAVYCVCGVLVRDEVCFHISKSPIQLVSFVLFIFILSICPSFLLSFFLSYLPSFLPSYLPSCLLSSSILFTFLLYPPLNLYPSFLPLIPLYHPLSHHIPLSPPLPPHFLSLTPPSLSLLLSLSPLPPIPHFLPPTPSLYLPTGDSLTRKSLFDSLVAGCIPVLFSRASLTQYK